MSSMTQDGCDPAAPPSSCDVVVVGAGPAGSAAAYWAARAGARVVLLDRAEFPRPKTCGDGLTPRAVRALAEMGVDREVGRLGRRVVGVRVAGRRRHRSTVPLADDGAPPGVTGRVLPRRLLDDLLRRHAQSAGAFFMAGFGIREVIRRDGRTAGLAGVHRDREVTLAAPLLIVATGADRTLQRRLGMGSGPSPGGAALRTYVRDVADLDDHLEVHLLDGLFPGYAWVFPVDGSTANVGVGTTTAGPLDPVRLRDLLDRFLAGDRLRGGRVAGGPTGSPIRCDFPDPEMAAPGVLVAGEAAGLVNPLTGSGIGLALESGRLAADAAVGGLGRGELDRLPRDWESSLRSRFETDIRAARDLVERLRSPRVSVALQRSLDARSDLHGEMSAAFVAGDVEHIAGVFGDVLRCEPGVEGEELSVLGRWIPLLAECRSRMLAAVSRDTPAPVLMELLGRGKMLRPLLVLLGCRAAGGDPRSVLSAGAAFELIHAASLVHDDIMDGAATRRGMTAVHVTLDTSQAIVCGDYLIMKGFELLAETRREVAEPSVVDALEIGTATGIRTCVGQLADVAPRTLSELDEDEYHRVVTAKTSAAIRGALVSGAVLASGEPQLLERLGRYGRLVGRAFQIRDDVLDFEAPPGDESGPDRRPGLPLILAWGAIDPVRRDVLESFAAGGEAEPEVVAQLLRSAGALERASEIARRLAEEAAGIASSIPRVGRDLHVFARHAVARTR